MPSFCSHTQERKLTLNVQVVYQAGVNEKLLGDFLRKHNARDKVFGQSADIPPY